MTSTESTNSHLSWGQLLFLTIIVPLFFLGCIEGICRLLRTDQLVAPNKTALEMPTWFLEEANTRQRIASVMADRDTVDWLDIFQTGNGFRVHLTPNLNRIVTNTFSLSPIKEKYRVTSNSLGFRFSEPVGNQFFIRIFGDSSSFGWGVEFEQSIAGLLEAKIPSMKVANFAIPGDSSEYGRLIFEKFSPLFSAPITIVGFGANDAKLVTEPHQKQVNRFRERGGLQLLHEVLKKSSFVRTVEMALLRGSLNQASATPQKKVLAVSKRRYKENLRYLVDQSLGQNSSPVIMALCTPESYVNIAKAVALEKNVPFIDGGPILKNLATSLEAKSNRNRPLSPNEKALLVTTDGCHPNPKGYEAIASALIAALPRRP